MKPAKFIFPAFLVITLVTYYPTIGAGFVFDFLGWQKAYDQGSFADVLHCFSNPVNLQLLHLIFFSLYKIFHLQGLPWYLIFCALHAFNGWLLYKWVTTLSVQWNLNISPRLILFLSILFLIHPYSAEVVVWKVCIHYLLSFSAVFGLLLLVPEYVKNGKKKSLWFALLIFLCSLFLLEISFVTPLVITVLLVIYFLGFSLSKDAVQRSVILSASLWGLLAGYVILNKLTLGAWVGHYGSSMHLNLDIIGMMSTENKYLVKHLLDARFFSFNIKALIFDRILSIPEITFFILTGFISLLLLYLIKAKRLSSDWHLICFSILASMLYVLPVSNIYFYHLHIGLNDRYSYIPLAFLWVGVVTLLAKGPKWFSHGLMIVVLLINLYLQEKTNRYWAESTEVLNSLVKNYRWYDRSHVFILNSPDNLHGIVMASVNGDPSGIDEIIKYQTPKKNTGLVFDVFQFNMTTPDDGVTVEQTGPMQLKVTFKQWGNWWHRNGIGASSYENEFYKAEVLDYPYVITFKQLPPGSAIIYQDGKEWKEVEMKNEK